MEMRKCMRGHYYDASVHSACPYCNGSGGSEMTMPLGMRGGAADGMADDDGKTLPLGYVKPQQQAPAPQPVSAGRRAAVVDDDDDDGKTVAIIRQDTGIDPVVGWLVCVEGKDRGRDYRIHSDNNFVGRSDKMDICIHGDETVSRENHAVISYDSVDKTYYFSPGDGRSIVRLNDKALFQTATLKPYDKVTIGKTRFLFIPLCGEDFDWSVEE